MARKAALNSAAARPTTDRRIRRARRSIAARRLFASALAFSCSGVGSQGGRGLGLRDAFIVRSDQAREWGLGQCPERVSEMAEAILRGR